MNTVPTLIQIAVAVVILVLIVGRRFTPRPIHGDRRRWRLPIVLSVVGGYEVASLSHRTPPVAITHTDMVFLVVGCVISLALGLMRGVTVRIYRVDGELMQRYSAVTAALWLGTIAIRLTMDLAASSLGVAKDVASTSLLLMFGISLLGEALAVGMRVGDFSMRTLP